jgi:hypothetical protein
MLIEINRPNSEVKPAFSAPNNLLIQTLIEKPYTIIPKNKAISLKTTIKAKLYTIILSDPTISFFIPLLFYRSSLN